MTESLLIVIGYLLGSVSSAIIVCKLANLPDPRIHGSGNPGATNVLRIGGKRTALAALLGDMLKGVIPVLIGHAAGMDQRIIAAIAVAAFAGHLFPLYFGFRGGKGVATLTGVLLAMHWLVGLAFIGTWLLMAAIFRYSSLAALIATALAPAYAWYLTHSLAYVIAIGIIAAVLFWRHRSNIRNLLNGDEKRIGDKSLARDP